MCLELFDCPVIKVDLLIGAEWMRCVISFVHVVYDGGKLTFWCTGFVSFFKGRRPAHCIVKTMEKVSVVSYC